MNKIQRISSYLLMVFNLLLLGLPLFLITKWLFLSTWLDKGFFQSLIATPEGYKKLADIQWTNISTFIGFAANGLELLPFFLSLFVLKSIFKNYYKGEFFTVFNARHYSYLGWLFFIQALVLKPISELLMILAVTLSNPIGHRYIVFAVGMPNIEAVFCGILVIVISWVMREASQLQAEHQLTI